jgi:hypothetical protein
MNLLNLDKEHLDLIQLNIFHENLNNNKMFDLAIDDFEHYQNNAKIKKNKTINFYLKKKRRFTRIICSSSCVLC